MVVRGAQPDIRSFRDVRTVEECIRVREDWFSEVRAKAAAVYNPPA